MFPREKYAKNSQYFNNQNSSKNIVTSNKYFSKPFYKNQKQVSKKYKCDRLWKKNSSYHWSEKENDKNNSNFPHNKKFYFEGRKGFHYHKKISKTKFDYDFDYNEEEEKNQINENENEINFNEECGLSKENSKDEKNNSIEYNTNTTTTAYSYSNSSSAHEDITLNNSSGNNKENLNLNKYNYSNNDLALKKYSSEDIKQINKPFNDNLSKDLSNQFFSNLMKINMNLIRFNSTNEIVEYTPTKIQKAQNNKKKYSEVNSNSYESYNKYNAVNQDMNKLAVNPMTENTEILNVSVKISKNKKAVFKLRRFDDLFLTVKLFCEINQIEEKLMKPIIIKTLCSLNSIYQIYNFHLDEKSIQRLRRINSFINNTFI